MVPPKNLDYIPRLIDDVIMNDMRLFGGVVITGPKWCGKTTTAEQLSNSAIYLQDNNQYLRCKRMAELDVSLLLDSEPPLLIDEWQKISEIWSAVRYQIDRRKGKGEFILT